MQPLTQRLIDRRGGDKPHIKKQADTYHGDGVADHIPTGAITQHRVDFIAQFVHLHPPAFLHFQKAEGR